MTWRSAPIVLLTALLAAHPAPAQSCAGRSPHLARAVEDRSWIPSGLVLYGVNPFDGLFRLVPRSGAVTPIVRGRGGIAEGPSLSPDRHWLHVAFSDARSRTAWLYDLRAGRAHKLGTWPFSAAPPPMFSPDGAHLALFHDAHGDGTVEIVDLKFFARHTFSLAASRTVPTGQQHDSDDVVEATWAAAGDRILFARMSQDRSAIGWSLDIAGGALAQVALRVDGDRGLYDGRVTYAAGGQAIGTSCWGCEAPPPTAFDLEAGAHIALASDALTIPRLVALDVPGHERRIIAQSPPPVPGPGEEIVIMSACGPGPADVLGTFDGHIALYRIDDIYWLYDLRGGAKVAIWRGDTSFRW